MTCFKPVLLLLGIAPLAWPVAAADSRKPTLELRVSPPVGLPSTSFFFVAELKGGPETEDLYCPGLEWEWGLQETIVEEPVCPPFQSSVTRIERRFSLSRSFTAAGERTLTLSMRKDGKVIARARASFRVAWKKGPPRIGVVGGR